VPGARSCCATSTRRSPTGLPTWPGKVGRAHQRAAGALRGGRPRAPAGVPRRQRRDAGTCCWSAPAGYRTAPARTRRRRSRHRGRRRVLVDEYQRTTRRTSTRSVTSARPTSSSTWPTTRRKIVRAQPVHPDAPRRADHRFVPSAVFTAPQIGHRRADEEELPGARGGATCQRAGLRRWLRRRWRPRGFCKLLADRSPGSCSLARDGRAGLHGDTSR